MIYRIIARIYEYIILKLTRHEFTEKLIKKLDRREIEGLSRLNSFYSKFKQLGFNHNIPIASFVNDPKYISIGNNFGAWHNLRIEAIDHYGSQEFNPELVIGNNVNIGSDCHIGCINKVIIGDNVLMAGRVFITDHFHGRIDKEDIGVAPTERILYSKGPVIIMNNVWIGEGVCIMPGVTIGENVIIGANSVVTKDIEKNSVVAGNPAKLIKVL